MVDETDDRHEAIKRVKAKRDFKTHVLVYLVVNASLVVIWAASDAGYFWPIWSIGFWGMGLVFNWWSAYHENRPISEEEIQREMGKRKS
jgi:uncharacterized ion transporter superfamily protein YfcC